MVSPKCSVNAGATRAVSCRPSWAIWVVWLPCGWNGWLSTPALTIRISAGSVLAVLFVGRIRTSAPYGWFGSNPEPLSWIVSGNSRPLMVKYRLSRALKSYVLPVSTAWCRTGSMSASSSRYSRAGVELRRRVAVGGVGAALGRTISAPYRPISTCFATSEPLS